MGRLVVTAASLLALLSHLCLAGEQPSGDGKVDNQQWLPECGATNPNNNYIDQTEPEKPGPFHDLTSTELRKLREFLEKDPKIKAVKSSNATINSSYIFTADLHLPKKSDVLNYLDKGGVQPDRMAHVIMFRGDRAVPVVEECVCGPLPDITKCELLIKPNKRNPAEFSVRPLNGLEIQALKKVVLTKVDKKIGSILMESYGAKFTECVEEKDCLASSSAPVGTGLLGDINARMMWVNAMYNLNYPTLHVLDFAVLVNFNDTDPDKWTFEKVWYSNKVFTSLDDLLTQYNSNSISKTKVTKPADDKSLFSSLRLREDAVLPPKPQRPPRMFEPDGKRYTVKEKKVEYMGWSFHYRLSPLTGPALYDVRYKGERILYEMSMAELAVVYSGFAPFGQTLNEVEGSKMLGSRSRAVVQGAGCHESGTSLSAVFMSQYSEEPAFYDSAFCLFENTDGHEMRSHRSYTASEGGFYNGLSDTQLIVRTAISVMSNDYIVDFLFHQNGVIHARTASTGYIQTSFFTSAEKPYGHRIQENIVGNIRHNLINFKVDLDVGGTSNRYETLDIVREKTKLTAFLDQPYSQPPYSQPCSQSCGHVLQFLDQPYYQTRLNSTLKVTEREAVYNFDFSSPKYHLVHNNEKRNKFNESRAYRIEMRGMSKSMLKENWGNERSIQWARHQMVVTKHKEDECTSSSIYAMLDSHQPVLNFSAFYEDDEDIVDEDLVFWITSGSQHIPHSEDLPNIAAINNQLSFFLLPHNYFPECPSMGSRDAIYIEYKDPKDPSKGVKVDRNGNSRDQCVLSKPSLEEDMEDNPDRILESRRHNPTDF